MKKKNAQAVELVCRNHCSYYKPEGKEDFACRGYAVVETLLAQSPEIQDVLLSSAGKAFEDAHHETLHHLVCRSCDFFIHGCDFTDPGHQGDPLPCGGYVVLDRLLTGSPFPQALFDAALLDDPYVVLSPHCILKQLESPFLYDLQTDELYEVDGAGFGVLARCDGTRRLSEVRPDPDFLEACLADGLVQCRNAPERRRFVPGLSPIPSLRYLELQLTNRCNLQCKHCYLGSPQNQDLSLAWAETTLEMLEKMQGLRVLFSGGEPLLYPHLSALNRALPRFGLRKVLLTNGTLLREGNYPDWCHFDEIQFSLDGLERGHEALRGKGSFAQTMAGMEAARKKGVPISIATMVHRHNLSEWDALEDLIDTWDVVEWNIDVPCRAGRLLRHGDLWVEPEEGAPFLKRARGGSYHGSEEPFACGLHLCTVTPVGEVLKCGFFPEHPLGVLGEGLETCWKRAQHVPLSDLECGPCAHLADCKGGCRFRASTPEGKDPVMCALFGVSPQTGNKNLD